jgi:polar amino acid transport system substrate-binding protein
LNFDKLGVGRFDYFLSPHYPAQSFLIATGQESKFKALQPYAAQAPNFVDWSKRSECLDRLGDFDQEIDRMIQAGEVDKAVRDAVDAWRGYRSRNTNPMQ